MSSDSFRRLPPKENRVAYVLKDHETRLQKIENPRATSVWVGRWVLKEDPTTGNLVALNTRTGVTRTIALP